MPRAAGPKAKSSEAAIKYSVHPGVAMVQKWVTELKAKTGRTLEEWCGYITKEGPDELPARRNWLKDKHKLGTNTAWWLAERADGHPTWDESPESYLAIAPTYVDEMFAGPKALLRPLADALMRMALGVAKDIKFCRARHHPVLPRARDRRDQPATRTRIDFGLALGPDTPFTARLKDTKGIQKKDRITHKIEVTKMEDLDAELRGWLKKAYDRDG